MFIRRYCLGFVLFLFAAFAQAQNTLVVHDGTAGLEANVVTNLSNKLIAAGYTVSTNVGVPAGTLASYEQVWDVRFNNTTPLSGPDQASYLAYLQGGGSLFVMGENTGFATRNASIIALVASAGGGAIAVSAPVSNTQTVLAPFNTGVPTMIFLAGAGVAPLGSGAPITTDGSRPIAVVWGPGALSNALTGTLITVFDVNFLDLGADAASQQFGTNLVNYLAAPIPIEPVAPAVIPTMSEWGLIALSCLLGLFTIIAIRRKQA